MGINKPYPKMYRHGPPNVLTPFLHDLKRVTGPSNLAAFELLKQDLKRIFEFVEPTKQTQLTFSHRIYEIILRACTEVESLCKQIFEANGHTIRNMNIIRFSDLEGPMKLSQYSVQLFGYNYPEIFPFETFRSNIIRNERSPIWYRAYNSVKHNRNTLFEKASLQNAIEAVGGVFVLLSAMYGFGFDSIAKISPGSFHLMSTPTFFSLLNRPKWSTDEQYDYKWSELQLESEPFQLHPIPKIPDPLQI